MKIRISVMGLPPKKDGANSMWRKKSEINRLKDLRNAANQAMGTNTLARHSIGLNIELHALPGDGDLDNFITGICDSLMAVHPRTPWNDTDWSDVDHLIKPDRPIVYENDALVTAIHAERFTPEDGVRRYEIVLDIE